jgi:hypothetical protein
MSNEYDLQQIRAKAQKILERVNSDDAFRQKAQADPLGVLAEYGLPQRAIPDFMRETDGHLDADDGCNDYTCIVSHCSPTCYVTKCITTQS